jgi:hypothetical protein
MPSFIQVCIVFELCECKPSRQNNETMMDFIQSILVQLTPSYSLTEYDNFEYFRQCTFNIVIY